MKHKSTYETCKVCGVRKPLDYFTKGGLCDRICEECGADSDYIPRFARKEAEQMAVNALLANEKEITGPYMERTFDPTVGDLAVASGLVLAICLFAIGVSLWG